MYIVDSPGCGRLYGTHASCRASYRLQCLCTRHHGCGCRHVTPRRWSHAPCRVHRHLRASTLQVCWRLNQRRCKSTSRDSRGLPALGSPLLLACLLSHLLAFSLSRFRACTPNPQGRAGHPRFPPFPDPRLHSICRRLLSDPSRWGLADSPCPAPAHVTDSKRTPASPRLLLATVSPRRLRTRSTTPNACCCCRPSTTSTAIGTASSPRHRRVRPGRLCSRRAAKSCAFPTSIL